MTMMMLGMGEGGEREKQALGFRLTKRKPKARNGVTDANIITTCIWQSHRDVEVVYEGRSVR